jgi:hypothetical protein
MTAGRLPSSKRSSQAEICQAAWIAFALAGDGGAGNKATSVWPRQRFFSCMVPCMFALSVFYFVVRATLFCQVSSGFIMFYKIVDGNGVVVAHINSLCSALLPAILSRAHKISNKSLISLD